MGLRRKIMKRYYVFTGGEFAEGIGEFHYDKISDAVWDIRLSEGDERSKHTYNKSSEGRYYVECYDIYQIIRCDKLTTDESKLLLEHMLLTLKIIRR
jgi:hypothetical protein